MKSNKKFVVGAIAIALLGFAGLAWYQGSQTEQKQTAEPGVDTNLLIKPHSPIKGNINAPVTIVEFLDPECEACRAMYPIVNTLLSEYEGKVRLVIRYMPLHGNSKLAASAIEEARQQDKFIEALNILFEKQPEWADHHQPRPELITVFLKQIGVEEKTLDPTAVVAKHGWKIDQDQADGTAVGANRTPTFFVNGKRLPQIGYDPLKQAIEEALKNQN